MPAQSFRSPSPPQKSPPPGFAWMEGTRPQIRFRTATGSSPASVAWPTSSSKESSGRAKNISIGETPSYFAVNSTWWLWNPILMPCGASFRAAAAMSSANFSQASFGFFASPNHGTKTKSTPNSLQNSTVALNLSGATWERLIGMSTSAMPWSSRSLWSFARSHCQNAIDCTPSYPRARIFASVPSGSFFQISFTLHIWQARRSERPPPQVVHPAAKAPAAAASVAMKSFLVVCIVACSSSRPKECAYFTIFSPRGGGRRPVSRRARGATRRGRARRGRPRPAPPRARTCACAR